LRRSFQLHLRSEPAENNAILFRQFH
jgi:hypothetical protein